MTRQTFEDFFTASRTNLLVRIGLSMFLIGGFAAFGLRSLGLRLDHADPATSVLLYGLFVWWCGCYMLVATTFGMGTFHALRRTRETIDRFQRLPAAWQAKQSGMYCDRVGIKAAAFQRGFEAHLLPKIRNTWSGPVA